MNLGNDHSPIIGDLDDDMVGPMEIGSGPHESRTATAVVAAAQMCSTDEVSANLRTIQRLAADAAHAGADLVVFPELAMIDPRCDDRTWWAAGQPLDGPFVDSLRATAANLGIAMIVGVLERVGEHRLPQEDRDGQGEVETSQDGSVRSQRSKYYNTLVVIDSAGSMVARYRKIHLFDALGVRESDRIDVADPEIVTAEISGLRIGLMTCYDLRFPELARALVNSGADVLALPAAWYGGPGKLRQWQTLTQARAIENTAFVVAACQPTPTFVGHSTVIGPDGAVLAQAGDVEQVVCATIGTEALAEIRTRMPSLQHQRLSDRRM